MDFSITSITLLESAEGETNSMCYGDIIPLISKALRLTWI